MKALLPQRLVLAALVLGAGSVALGTGAPAAAQDTCRSCHGRHWNPALRAPVTALRASVHGEGGLSCASCHGGRPDEPSVAAHDTTRGFVPRPGAARVIEICGGCHADASRVPAGFRTDQLGNYRASQHGQRLADNPRVATCISCHGAHDVRRVRDPASPVNPDNVSDTCSGCHSDPETMQSSGLPTDQYRRWRRSVHGHAALDKTLRRRPTCAACHTGHSVRHGTLSLSACNQCHEELVNAFRNGPHPEAFEHLGFNACVECHGNHEVQEADASLIGTRRDSACRRCHSEGQVPFTTVARAGAATARAERAARSALRRVGSDEQARRRILDARHKLRLALHALDADEIDATANELVAAAQSVRAQVRASTISVGGLTPTLLVSVIALGAGIAVLGLWMILRGRRA